MWNKILLMHSPMLCPVGGVNVLSTSVARCLVVVTGLGDVISSYCTLPYWGDGQFISHYLVVHPGQSLPELLLAHQLHSIDDNKWLHFLTHLSQYYICASVNWVSIGLDNGLSPIRHQAII